MYLHDSNWQILQISAFASLRELVVNCIYQHNIKQRVAEVSKIRPCR